MRRDDLLIYIFFFKSLWVFVLLLFGFTVNRDNSGFVNRHGGEQIFICGFCVSRVEPT